MYALRGIALDCVAKDDLLIPDYNKTPMEVLVHVMYSLRYHKLPAVEGTGTARAVKRGRLFSSGKGWDPLEDFTDHLKSKLVPLQSFELVKRARGPNVKPPQARNFSTTVHSHNTLVRICLPRMTVPILIENVPVKQHTRLSYHQPLLRRDTPVRVSLPSSAPRYILAPP